MLNRIYIILGLLAIVLLVGAFVVPRFVDWSSFRGRMEALAVEALGTDVKITGRIEFTLLPQPRMSFDDVVVGPPDNPVMSVKKAEAEFSLMDFMRDRYFVQRLVLTGPELNLTIGADGKLALPISLPTSVGASNVSIANAALDHGTIKLTDERSGQSFEATNFEGTLKLTALRGPFALQGNADLDGRAYTFRANTSTMNSDGTLSLTSFVKPLDSAFSLSSEGILLTGSSPKFTGSLVYRSTPEKVEGATEVRGDLVWDSKIEATPEKVLVSSYTLLPDENRAGTRLTGAVVIRLGAESDFDAVISGGVFGLPPRDARADTSGEPFEIVRLLQELGAPPIPPMPGRIGADIAELDLRAFSIRDLRIDASTDGKNWLIDDLTGRLPGDTDLSLGGNLGVSGIRPTFAGSLRLASRRLDGLALLWRRASNDNPLFGMAGKLSASLSLTSDRLDFKDGTFDLDGVPSSFSGSLGFGSARELAVTAKIGRLATVESAALGALMPEMGNNSPFEGTFPDGKFDLTADRATLFGLEGTSLSAAGSWDAEGLSFRRLAAASLGGASLDLTGRYESVPGKPLLSGSGHLTLPDSAADGILPPLLDLARLSDAYRTIVDASLPADLSVDLSALNPEGGQTLSIDGKAGAAALETKINLAAGIFKAVASPLTLSAEVTTDDPAALTAQLGLGDVSLLAEGENATISVAAEGAPLNSLELHLDAEAGTDHFTYAGSLILTDPAQLRGKGLIDFALSDPAPLIARLGAEGIYLPALAGKAEINLGAGGTVGVSQLQADTGGVHVTGGLTRTSEAGATLIGGDLSVSELAPDGLFALLGGPSSILAGDALWPDGPFEVTSGPRTTRGRVHVTTPRIALGPKAELSDAGFDLTWDETSHRIRGLEAKLGGGTATLEVTVCCAGAQADKHVFGRLGLNGVALENILPPPSSGTVGGTLTGSATFDGTGPGFAPIIGVLAGDGSFSIKNLAIEGFDPGAFASVAKTPNILDMEPEALSTIVSMALSQGTLVLPELSGVFTVAGGKIRTRNLAASSPTGQLVGGTDIDLSTLGLSGNWSLSPVGDVDPGGLITESTSRISVAIDGTLLAPRTVLDLQPMVDAIKVRAYELEVDRLEKLKAEDEARARAAAADRARLMELEAQKKAADALAKAEAEGLLPANGETPAETAPIDTNPPAETVPETSAEPVPAEPTNDPQVSVPQIDEAPSGRLPNGFNDLFTTPGTVRDICTAPGGASIYCDNGEPLIAPDR